VCCDANGDPIEDFASDEPGGDNVAQVSLSGVLCDGALARVAPRGLFCECVGVSVELDLLLQEGQTEAEGSWTANLSVAPAP
jgi:hypothetical protein